MSILSSAMVVAMEYGTDFSDGRGDRDWALLKLDRPLGDRYGWLGWLTIGDYSDLSWSEGKINNPTSQFSRVLGVVSAKHQSMGLLDSRLR